jgi:hypothetical protein
MHAQIAKLQSDCQKLQDQKLDMLIKQDEIQHDDLPLSLLNSSINSKHLHNIVEEEHLMGTLNTVQGQTKCTETQFDKDLLQIMQL